MCKIKLSFQTITPFGGLNFIFSSFVQKGILKFLDKELGSRSVLAKYSYSDVLFSLFSNALCNGEYIADLEHLKRHHWGQLFYKIPSPDTVEYVCKALAVKTDFITGASGAVHQINKIDKMNKLLVSLCCRTNLLLPKQKNLVLDYDNMIIENDKYDASLTYKKTKGYQPGVAFIGRNAVHLENRNGNTPAVYRQKEILTQCLDNLENNFINVAFFRGDSASYQKEVIELMNSRKIKFFIRNQDSLELGINCRKVENWETVEINNEKKEVASVFLTPFLVKNQYRVVVTRTPKKTQQYDLLTQTAYNYYGIITNDTKKNNKEVIEFYNQRGDASENSNKYLLHDFNMKRLPFSDLDTNTVYMYLMAICNNLFEYLKLLLEKNEIIGIQRNSRTKRVFFRYILFCCKIQQKGRQNVIQIINGDKLNHKPLLI